MTQDTKENTKEALEYLDKASIRSTIALIALTSAIIASNNKTRLKLERARTKVHKALALLESASDEIKELT